MTLFHSLSWQEILLRLGIAAVCGLVIGFDREVKHKPMGLRTFMIVTTASAALIMVVMEITDYYLMHYTETQRQGLRVNPTEIVAGIVTGIGFLGGGAILKEKDRVIGSTTGASIWMSGAIGSACGFGLFGLGLILTAFALVIITGLGWVEHHLMQKYQGPVNKEKE